MLAVVFALVAALALGVSDFYGTLATRRIGSVATTLAGYSTATMLIALGLLIVPSVWSFDAVFFGALAGVSIAIGFLTFYLAVAAGPVAVVAPMIAVLYAAIPVAWAVARGELLSALGWVGVGIGVIAVLALSIPPKDGAENSAERAVEASQGRGTGPRPATLALAVIAALGLGGATIAMDYVPSGSGIAPALIQSAVAVLVVAVVWVFVPRPPRGEFHTPSLGMAAWSGLLLGLGNGLFVLALQLGSLALVSVLVALYPLSTILLARFVLKEHLSRIQWAGVGLAVLAAVLLGAA